MKNFGNQKTMFLCAEMIKLAMYKFDKDYFAVDETEGLVLTIHDELIAEIKTKNAEKAARVLENSMIYGVQKFMPHIKVHVEAKIMGVWEK